MEHSAASDGNSSSSSSSSSLALCWCCKDLVFAGKTPQGVGRELQTASTQQKGSQKEEQGAKAGQAQPCVFCFGTVQVCLLVVDKRAATNQRRV